MTKQEKRRARIAFILWHEPSWIAEAGTSAALVMWGVLAFMPGHHAILTWGGYVLPALAIVSGPIRMRTLYNLNTIPRATGAMTGCILSGCIGLAMISNRGVLPAEGYVISATIVDFITLMKFSISEIPDMIEDIKAWFRLHR
jgi:hypothetical protein